jgi:hypothetical protein
LLRRSKKNTWAKPRKKCLHNDHAAVSKKSFTTARAASKKKTGRTRKGAARV